jgi:hypothetical protein
MGVTSVAQLRCPFVSEIMHGRFKGTWGLSWNVASTVLCRCDVNTKGQKNKKLNQIWVWSHNIHINCVFVPVHAHTLINNMNKNYIRYSEIFFSTSIIYAHHYTCLSVGIQMKLTLTKGTNYSRSMRINLRTANKKKKMILLSEN